MSSDIKYSIFPSAFYHASVSEQTHTPVSLGYALTNLMKSAGDSSAFMITFDEKLHHIRTVRLKRRGLMNSETVAATAERVISETNASNFVLVHNHPIGILTPSSADRITTELLMKKYSNSGVRFLEHYIVSGDEYVTMINKTTNSRYDLSGKDKT